MWRWYLGGSLGYLIVAFIFYKIILKSETEKLNRTARLMGENWLGTHCIPSREQTTILSVIFGFCWPLVIVFFAIMALPLTLSLGTIGFLVYLIVV